jgi:hypothetical protein
MQPDFVFLSLARDCEATIPNFLALLDRFRSDGLNVTAIIGENGSQDRSRDVLTLAADAGAITLVPTPFMAAEPDRLKRMALGRQYLKTTLETMALEPRFVCVVDIDNVMRKPPSVAAVLAAAAKLDRTDVFGVSATSRPHYYDLLAFQDESMAFETLLDELARQRTSIFAYRRFFQTRIYPCQHALTTDQEITCWSAFNGMCIYRAGTYRSGSYLADGAGVCEHVVFNRAIAWETGARMLIDPGLALLTPADHRQESFMPFAWRRLKKLAKSYRT